MPIGIGLGIDVGILLRGNGGGVPAAYVTLSNSTINESAGIGDLVGVFSVVNGSGSYTYTLTYDGGGLFAVDVANLEVAAVLNAGLASVTVSADNGVDAPTPGTFPITITAAIPPTNNATFYWLGF